MVFVTAFFTVSYAEFWPGTAGFPPLNNINNVNNSSISLNSKQRWRTF